MSITPTRFRDRHEAGRRLADKLVAYAKRPDVLVLALPRGGVPVAYEVARALHAAIAALRRQQPARIVVAVPTAPPEMCEALRAEVDDVICAITPQPFQSVGLWYEDFSPTTDEEVRELLARAARVERAA